MEALPFTFCFSLFPCNFVLQRIILKNNRTHGQDSSWAIWDHLKGISLVPFHLRIDSLYTVRCWQRRPSPAQFCAYFQSDFFFLYMCSGVRWHQITVGFVLAFLYKTLPTQDTSLEAGLMSPRRDYKYSSSWWIHHVFLHSNRPYVLNNFLHVKNQRVYWRTLKMI